MMNLNTGRSLHDAKFKPRYRSYRDDVVEDFYIPALQASVEYGRAVGYFTSSSLALYARGLEGFLDRFGSIRLVASPHLTAEDIRQIESGYEVRQLLERATLSALQTPHSGIEEHALGLLGTLIAEGRLDIKLALTDSRGLGIYHEKLGYFKDRSGNHVAFTGSSNETAGGLTNNFESVEVYKGWSSADRDRARELIDDFDNLWNNNTPGLQVYPFPEVARERLTTIAARSTNSPRAPLVNTETSHEMLTIPEHVVVRPYQRNAVDSWLSNNGRGILKMATGTGKTKTSLIAATKLAEILHKQDISLAVVIVAPYQHLVDQWLEDVQEFGVSAVPIYESTRKWLPLANESVNQARFGRTSPVVFVATNTSFAGEAFQSLVTKLSIPILVIADEAHNVGSETMRAALPANAQFRLALSATPERWLDEEGTDAMIEYFGPIVFELGLGAAIDMGALCRYEYYPRLITLDTTEANFYGALSAKIAAQFARGGSLEDDGSDSPLGRLLRQRSGILGHASGKVAELRNDLLKNSKNWFQLIYCAEGSRPAAEYELPGPNQVEKVLKVVGNDLGLSTHVYHAETPREQRRQLLDRFASGADLRTLVSMRCLDEGVDIPDARVGYLLASSSNPRQFIQRRGRLLRPAIGKRRAVIYDYLAIPPADSALNPRVERQLLIRELERANEFAKLSETYGDTLKLLQPLKERYHLRHL